MDAPRCSTAVACGRCADCVSKAQWIRLNGGRTIGPAPKFWKVVRSAGVSWCNAEGLKGAVTTNAPFTELSQSVIERDTTTSCSTHVGLRHAVIHGWADVGNRRPSNSSNSLDVPLRRKCTGVRGEYVVLISRGRPHRLERDHEIRMGDFTSSGSTRPASDVFHRMAQLIVFFSLNGGFGK